MLLLIDAGNTQIKWAVLNPAQQTPLGEWMQTGSLSHQELIDLDNDLNKSALPWDQLSVQRAIVSNVAGHALRDLLTAAFQQKNIIVEWLVPAIEKAGIRNQYRNPTQLGSDRFAAAIAAHALFPGQALIIATCGTALTIDAVTADGDFIGGMIAPGLKLMAQSLANNTAQLPAIAKNNHGEKAAHFAGDTEAAIVSGCLAAQAGAIEYAVREFVADKHIVPTPLCIVSGGAAQYIIPSLTIPHKSIDNLVLIGLQVIA